MEKKTKNNKCKAYFIYTGLFAVIFLLKGERTACVSDVQYTFNKTVTAMR